MKSKWKVRKSLRKNLLQQGIGRWITIPIVVVSARLQASSSAAVTRMFMIVAFEADVRISYFSGDKDVFESRIE